MDQDWKVPEYTVTLQMIPFTQMIDWGVKDLGIPELWAEFGMAEDIRVCVLDTGQPMHLDLVEGLVEAKDFTNSTRGVRDLNGHSTHCNGIIGARHNELGTAGVGPKCLLMNGKVLGDNGSGSTPGIVAGFEWGAANGADVFSVSLGSPSPSQAIISVINSLPATKILCCAAGNAGPGESWDYPGAHPRAISVASTNQLKKVSNYSSRNAQVDIGAPGEQVTSTWLNDQVATLNGTSMACPFIAGLAAVAIGYCRKTNRPPLTHEAFHQLLIATADDLGPPGHDPASGWGLVNPRRLLERLKAVPPIVVPTPPVPPVPPIIGQTTIIVSGAPIQPGTYTL